MSKSSVKRPVTPNSCSQSELQRTVSSSGFKTLRWSDFVYDCIVSVAANGILNLNIDGGSDNGEFAYFGELYQERINYIQGRADENDIILEIQGQKVAGYTQRDIVAWLNHCCRNGSPVSIKATKAGYLTKDLRQYLNTRFLKGSLDHDLQNTIRDNLYLRTVPCTTRLPREGEVNGVDYTFLSPEEFIALEKSGNLLESGVYEGNLYGTPRPSSLSATSPLPKLSSKDSTSPLTLPLTHSLSNTQPCNHYGTPKPPKESPVFTPQRGSGVFGSDGSLILPGAHPSSEGKRRRNRSNVEAMAAKSMDPEEPYHNQMPSASRSSTPTSGKRGRKHSGDVPADDCTLNSTSSDLGPLPDNWEKAYTETGEPYFINHNTGNSQWLDPRLARVQKKSIEDCDDDELPYGWERIDDPHYGTYYIDHVNRRTQYENPVLQARRGNPNNDHFNSGNYWQPHNGPSSSSSNGHNLPGTESMAQSFTPNSTQPTSEHSWVSNGSHQVQQQQVPPPNTSTASTPSSTAATPNNNNQSQGHMVPGQTNTSSVAAPSASSAVHRHQAYVFTCNPEELQGEIVRTALVKSARGFGFTIVGGDDGGATEEFLQIKSVVPNGPAWLDGKLQTGDVLVFVNEICVLGFSHQDVVSLFQSIPPEETVQLEVCRGYPLPFDPEDPNNEILTTVAVNTNENMALEESGIYSSGHRVNNNLQETSGAGAGTNENGESLGRAAKSMPDLSVRSVDGAKPQRHNSADLLSATENTPDILDFNPQSSSKPEFITVEIVKGTAGFGFTIADSAYGQKVKKILDRPRCKLLQEGDILVEINTQDVRGLVHAQVVQVLKDCPCGDSALITVQRGGFSSPSRPKGKSSKGKHLESSKKTASPLSQSFHFPETSSNSGYLPPLHGAYRSKTPTADLYSSREKETVSVNRPKTPLVDTRNWSQSPEVNSHSLPKLNNNNNSPGNCVKPSQASPNSDSTGTGVHGKSDTFYGSKESSRAPVMSVYNNSNGSKQSKADDFEVNRNKNYQWLSRSFRDTRTSAPKDRFNYPQRHSDTKLRDMVYDKENLSNPPKNVLDYNGIYSVDDGSFHRSPYASEDWRQHHHPSNYPFTPSGHGNWMHERLRPDIPMNYDAHNPPVHNKQPMLNGPYYQSYYDQHSVPLGVYDVASGYSGHPNSVQSSNHYHRQDSSSGYYTSAAISPHPSNTSQSLNGSQYDSLTRRKHSTSFEHEQPITSSLAQYSKDLPTFSHYGATTSRSSMLGANAVDMSVTLNRQESGFGFRIVGGTEEGSQKAFTFYGSGLVYHKVMEQTSSTYIYSGQQNYLHCRKSNHMSNTVSIGHIVPGGAADLDGRLQTGDEIVSVDGQLVMNTSHHHVVQLMGGAAHSGKVTLGIRRRIPGTYDMLGPPKSPDSIYPYDVTVIRKENEGFGFVIISSVSRVGSTIGRIIEGSPAERCGQLHVGDRILAVNGVNILNMHHGEIVNLIKDSGFSVSLTIGQPQDDASSSASVSQRGDDQSLEPDDLYYAVELFRGARGFGFSIRGGKEFHNMPLFVLRIAESGPAYQDGRLQVGDQIIEINGINTKDITHAEAIEIIKHGGNSVRMLVKRGGKVPLAMVDHPSPVTPTGSLGTPLSGHSSLLNGPICQSSPRDPTANYEMPRDVWNYETR